jgi:hypothetical protein
MRIAVFVSVCAYEVVSHMIQHHINEEDKLTLHLYSQLDMLHPPGGQLQLWVQADMSQFPSGHLLWQNEAVYKRDDEV